MFEDKTLKCKECGADFIFTAGEQEFYAEKGFQKMKASSSVWFWIIRNLAST